MILNDLDGEAEDPYPFDKPDQMTSEEASRLLVLMNHARYV